MKCMKIETIQPWTKLLVRVREKGVFPGGQTTLFHLLKEMGFRHTLRDDKLYFYERRDIMEQRHNYLKNIMQYRREDRPIVYLDETWANSHMAPERLWLDEQGRGGWKRPSGKGQ